jgi:inhibitor of Bruton tyrosine kinase
LICSVVVLRHVNLDNVIAILANATYYNALPLVERLHDFIACNLEALMESHFLDNMDEDLMKSLSGFVRSRQADKSPIMRSNVIAETALRNASTWLELQDLPQPVIRNYPLARNSPKLDPVGYDQSMARRASGPTRSPLPSPTLRAGTRHSPPRTPGPNQGDEIFAMEDVHVDSIPTLHIGHPQTPTDYTVPGQAWKSKSRSEPAK